MSAQIETYRHYVRRTCPAAGPDVLSASDAIGGATRWDEPRSAVDWNNIAVLALVEAEQAHEPDRRQARLAAAMEALYSGLNLEGGAICGAHIALIYALLGDTDKALEMAFATFVGALQPAYDTSPKPPPALVYRPGAQARKGARGDEAIAQMLRAGDGAAQLLLLLSDMLWRMPLVFYNAVGLRFLDLAGQLWRESAEVYLRLGITYLMNNRPEGLLHLHRAADLAPDGAPALQALYTAYQGLGVRDSATYWLERARAVCPNPRAPEWRWVQEAANPAITYVPFESALSLAVESSCRSIVTSVLLAEGDWFEQEMDFWRNWIEPGMTVVDVGANVGVYTFSAALRVGRAGRILAIEPFSRCVQCLRETVRLNRLDQVTVCAGAASDRESTARLRLQAASELNEIIPAAAAQALPPGSYETVDCFTLDALCRRENIARVDFLKIDAEGHELAVLTGARNLLKESAPVIIYENIVGDRGGDVGVTVHLKQLGYKLFRYQPFLAELTPAETAEERRGALNIIAIPAARVHQFSERRTARTA